MNLEIEAQFKKAVANFLRIDASLVKVEDIYEFEKGVYNILAFVEIGMLKIEIFGNAINKNGNGEVDFLLFPCDFIKVEGKREVVPLAFAMSDWEIIYKWAFIGCGVPDELFEDD